MKTFLAVPALVLVLAAPTGHAANPSRLPDMAREGASPTRIAEADTLSPSGQDLYGRPVRLSPGARQAWLAMRAAALSEGITLELISGYRSRTDQTRIIERKIRRGWTMAQALAVNAAPGYSEHHSGNAIDIGVPNEPAAEESFERTSAFRWLGQHAGEFGFTMSYPRGNQQGFVYEPWHWCWHEASEPANPGQQAIGVAVGAGA